jgi:hypothetical protein
VETDASKHFYSGLMTNRALGGDVRQFAITVQNEIKRRSKNFSAGMRRRRRFGQAATIGARARHGAE